LKGIQPNDSLKKLQVKRHAGRYYPATEKEVGIIAVDEPVWRERAKRAKVA
jgi:hypothetical protein